MIEPLRDSVRFGLIAGIWIWSIEFTRSIDGVIMYSGVWRTVEIYGELAVAILSISVLGFAIFYGLPAIIVTSVVRRASGIFARAAGVLLTVGLCLMALRAGKLWWESSHGSAYALSMIGKGGIAIGVAGLIGTLEVWRGTVSLYLERNGGWQYKLGAALFVAGSVVIIVNMIADTVSRPGPMPAQSTMRGPQRIFLITIDTLSASHLSLYGYGRPTTPNLERFAKGATVFDKFYANSNFTTPGIFSILTGLRPINHGGWYGPSAASRRVREMSLLEIAKQAGYIVHWETQNPWASPVTTRLTQNWEDTYSRERWLELRFNQPFGKTNWPFYVWSLPLQHALYWLLPSLAKTTSYEPERVFDPAFQWVSNTPPDTHVFVWTHIFTPHDPYLQPVPFHRSINPGPYAIDALNQYSLKGSPTTVLGTQQAFDILRDRYDESIRYADAAVGEYLHHLDKAGFLKDAVVLITSDHGELFSESYVGHGTWRLPEEVTHVPLLVKLPGQKSPLRIKSLTEQVDLAPTLVELMGSTPDSSIDGRSVVPLLHGETMPEKMVFAMNLDRDHSCSIPSRAAIAVYSGEWKGVLRQETAEFELYRLSSDPSGSRDVSEKYPDVARFLRTEAEQLLNNRDLLRLRCADYDSKAEG